MSKKVSRVGVFVHHTAPGLPEPVASLFVHSVEEEAFAGGDPVRQVQDPVVDPEADDEQD